MTNYNYAYKYPYLVAEALSVNDATFRDAFYQEGDQKNLLLELLKCLSKKRIQDTTIPGYIYKIVSSHLSDPDKVFKILLPQLDSIITDLFNDIDIDSYRDLLIVILDKGINSNNKDKFILYLDKIIDEIEILNGNIKNENNEKLKNIIYLLIALSKEKGDVVISHLFGKCRSEGESNIDKLINLFKKKSDNSMNDSSNSIMSWEECEFYRIIVELLVNLLRMTIGNIKNEELILTSIFDVNPIKEETLQWNNNYNKNKEQTNTEQMEIDDNQISHLPIDICIEIVKYLSCHLKMLFEVVNKIKNYALKAKSIPTITSNLSSSYPIVSRCYLSFLDMLTIILFYQSINNIEYYVISDEILDELWNDMVKYSNNSILNLKILKIYELLALKPDNLAERANQIFIKIEEYLSQNVNCDLAENRIISNKPKYSLNIVYIVKLYTLLEKIKKPNQKGKFEVYNNLIQNDLFKDQVQLQSEVKLINEDEIIEEKKDIHDTEAFIFTTKKTLETSKKVSQKLKEIDS